MVLSKEPTVRAPNTRLSRISVLARWFMVKTKLWLLCALFSFGCGGESARPSLHVSGANTRLTSPRTQDFRSITFPIPGLNAGTAPKEGVHEAADEEPGRRWAATVREPTAWQGDSSLGGNRRAAVAKEHKTRVVEALFEAAGVSYPPSDVFFRVFKDEAVLEVWASGEADAPMTKVAAYGICAASGKLGPKRREGDLQVPEGFYAIEYFWPDSAFYLAAKVSYPNTLDRALNPKDPGGQIMIHGNCASIGCLAMTDERIEEIFVIGTSVTSHGGRVSTHIFPSRDFDALLADPSYEEHHAFWSNLREGYALFEDDHRVPRVVVGHRGKYEFPERG